MPCTSDTGVPGVMGQSFSVAVMGRLFGEYISRFVTSLNERVKSGICYAQGHGLVLQKALGTICDKMGVPWEKGTLQELSRAAGRLRRAVIAEINAAQSDWDSAAKVSSGGCEREPLTESSQLSPEEEEEEE
eukprot:1882610-Rhodomonas_salina.2